MLQFIIYICLYVMYIVCSSLHSYRIYCMLQKPGVYTELHHLVQIFFTQPSTIIWISMQTTTVCGLYTLPQTLITHMLPRLVYQYFITTSLILRYSDEIDLYSTQGKFHFVKTDFYVHTSFSYFWDRICCSKFVVRKFLLQRRDNKSTPSTHEIEICLLSEHSISRILIALYLKTYSV